MSDDRRAVRRLRLRAADAAAARRAALLLEDALRCASLEAAAGAPGRVVLVRRLALGRLPARQATPQALALHCERQLAAAAAGARRHGAAPGAAAAPVVWFRDALDAHVVLGLRLAAGAPTDDWYWRLAVPGHDAAAGPDAGLRRVLASLAALPEAPAAVPAWVDALARAGRLGTLAAALDAVGVPPAAQAAVDDAGTARASPAGSRPPPPAASPSVRAFLVAALRRAGWPADGGATAGETALPPSDATPPPAARSGDEGTRPAGRPAPGASPAATAPAAPARSAGPPADAPASGAALPRAGAVESSATPPDVAAAAARGTSARARRGARPSAAGDRADAPAAADRLAPGHPADMPAPPRGAVPVGTSDAGAVPARRGAAALPASEAREAPPTGRLDPLRDDVPALRAAAALEACPCRPGEALRPTCAGGLLLLVPVLAALGYDDWSREFLPDDRAAVARRLFALLLDRLGVPRDDAAWGLAGGGAAAAAVDPAGVADAVDAGEPADAAAGGPAPGGSVARAPDRARLALHRRRAPLGPGRPLPAALPGDDATDARAAAWLALCRRRLRLAAGIGPATLVLRPALLSLTPTHADVWAGLRAIDLRVRRAGLDIDPGWVSWLGLVVAFRYEARLDAASAPAAQRAPPAPG